jgi:Spy/CpxP family protein refolding chaperone
MTLKGRIAGVVLAVTMAGAGPALAQLEESHDSPLGVVVEFLRLAPEQVQALSQLIAEREAVRAPIRLEIAGRKTQIRHLVASGGDPADVGRLVIEIHQLRQAGAAAQARFMMGFESVLTEEQRIRLQHLRVAAQVQPVLPAFVALSLL